MTTVEDAQPTPAGIRNTWILLAAQALIGSAAVMSIALGGLVGTYLLGDDKTLATVPVSGMALGQAAGAIPAALLMQRIGRRAGLMSGAAAAVAAGFLAAWAISSGSFVLFALALSLVGFSGAFVQQYRFAAAESVPPDMRGIAISRVMIGGVVSALIAPQILLYTRDLLEPVPFAGGFLALSVVALAGIAVLAGLRFPARNVTPGAVAEGGRRPLREVAAQPRFLVALLCATTAFALMAFVMTAAPIAMVGHQHSEADAVLGIQWHVIAMFAPSLFTGRLIRRFGKETITGTGLGLLFLSAVVGVAGVELLHFWGMLIVLGVGWNFAFVGATAMLTDTYRPAERGRVEGFNDFVVFGVVALASFFSGHLLATAGWSTLNLIVMPVAAAVLFSLLLLVFRERRGAAA